MAAVLMVVRGVGRYQRGGGGGDTDTYIYVPSVKNQYKRDVTGYMAIYVTAICVSFLIISTR